MVELSLDRALSFFDAVAAGARHRAADIAGPILKEVRERLSFLTNVGLEYLTLGRAAETLSGGEAQRIRLATQIGSRLVGVLYILDEPSIGLHQRDNRRLIATLEELRDLGNTVLVVEHDEETMRAADHIVDLGPRAGRHGGEVVAEGTLEDIVAAPALAHRAPTCAASAASRCRATRRAPQEGHELVIEGAREHNLQDIDARIPLGTFVAVTGVSGSGKSTLVNDILWKALSRNFYRAKLVPGRARAHPRAWTGWTRWWTSTSRPSGARPAPTPPPTPASSPSSAISSPSCPRARCAATPRAASPST